MSDQINEFRLIANGNVIKTHTSNPIAIYQAVQFCVHESALEAHMAAMKDFQENKDNFAELKLEGRSCSPWIEIKRN